MTENLGPHFSGAASKETYHITYYDVRVEAVAGEQKFALYYAGTGPTEPAEDADRATTTPNPVSPLVGGDSYVFR